MKFSKIQSIGKTTLTGIFITMLLFTFFSCAKKGAFLTSQVVPAARGFVKIKKDKNKNYVIHVEIDGLAEVKRLEPSKDVYIVWMESDNNAAHNLGQIKSASGLLSKSLKASFKSVSSTKPDKIFITAEKDVDASYPDSKIVLSTGNL